MIVFLSHPADASSNDQFSRTAWCGDANPDPSWESNLPFSIPNIFQTIADKSFTVACSACGAIPYFLGLKECTVAPAITVLL
jgi:hypothetical protein